MRNYLVSLVVLALALALAGCATASRGLMEDSVQSTSMNRSRGTFPYIGERLDFDVRHVATRAKLAEAHLEVGQPQVLQDGTPYIPIHGTGASIALARLLARVDDWIDAFIDPDTWETIYGFKHMDENGREREFFVWFWPDEMSATSERHYKGRVARRDYVLPPGTMDSMAWIYELRSFKFDGEDKKYTWYTFDGWTLNRVSIELEGEEDVWTEIGFFHCRKMKLLRERSEAAQPQGALAGVFIEPAREVQVPEYELATAWVAMDEASTPVRFVVTTGIGDFDLLLRSISREQAP